jgi:N-acetylneuraminic acid mutarotase
MRSFRRVTLRVAQALAAVASIVVFATCDLDKITSTSKPLDQNAIQQLFSIAPDTLVTLAGTLNLKLGAGSKVDATHKVLWSSSNKNIATVDSSSGVLSGLAIGTASIIARYIAPELDSEYTQSLAVRVRYKGIKVAPIDSIVGLGLSRAIVVNGTNNADAIQTPAITTSTLSTHDSGSTATTVTAISGQAVVGKKPGRAYVVSLFDSFRDSVIVRMRQVAKSITFPTTDYVATAINSSRLVPATVKDVADSVIVSPTLSWRVADTLVATIGASTGVIRVKKNDTTRIFVTSDTVTRSQKLTVQQLVALLNKSAGDAQSDTVALPIAILPEVTALDSGGTAVAGATVTFRIGANGGTVTDSVKTTDANGRATLGAWTLGTNAAAQTVIAASGTASTTFTATGLPQAPAKVGFSAVVPSARVGVVIDPPVVVAIQDQFGNTNTSATGSVSLAFSTNPGGATLGGTTTVAAVAGVATFSNLTVSATGVGYVLGASAAGVTSGLSNAFDVFGTPTKLGFVTHPANTTSGVLMNPAVQVAVQDAAGATVTNATDNVTLSINNCATCPPAGTGTLSGTVAVAAVNGVATFNSIVMSGVANQYKLGAAATGLTAALSNPFNVAGTNSWSGQTAMPLARSGAAGGVINGIMYVAGGWSAGDKPELQAFNPSTGSWSALASMPGGRYQGDGAGVINAELYVAGGWTTSSGLPNNNLFIYTPSTNTWRSGAAMPTLSGCGASGVIAGKLYVTTACDGSGGYKNFLHVYDPATNAWTALASSPNAHGSTAFGVIGGKLYVVGGYNAAGSAITGILDVYDPATNAWTTAAPMPTPRLGAVGAVVNGKLYVIGGSSDGTNTLATVEIYDPVSNSWTTGASMPTARFFSAVGVANGFIYVAGGGTGSTALTTFEVYVP